MNEASSGSFLVLAAVLICVFVNSDLPSVNNMEARNYVTAREILQDGSWLLPTMNGEPRIAKPPLPTWITAAFMRFSGTDANLAVNRVPAGIAGAMLALFTFLLVLRITGDRGLAVTTVLVLVTGYLFLWSARRNFWDIYAHAAMAGAVWAMVETFARRENRGRYLLLFTLLMAASFLSKGPVALWALFIPFLAAHGLAGGTTDLRANACGLLFGIGIAALLSASWPLYVYLNTPHDAVSVAVKESSNWFTYHVEAPWYYLQDLHWVTGLWLFFLLYAIVAPFVEKDWKKEEKLFVLWFLVTLVLLSVIPEKKIRYLLPAVVPGAAASAVAIHRLRQSGGRAWKLVYGPFCIVSGIAFLGAAAVMALLSSGRLPILAGALVLATVGAAVIASLAARRTRHTHLVVTAGVCLCLVLITPVKGQILGRDDAMELLILRKIPEIREREFFYLGDPPMELVWAAGRRVRAVGREEAGSCTPPGPGTALITTETLDPKGTGLRLVRTIETKDETYRVYCVLQDRAKSD
jgi:4-amino-4-deoxy-L-arabinose transferase-like glycosyltransferase